MRLTLGTVLACALTVACGDGTNTPDATPPPAANGEACVASDECVSELCMTEWADGTVIAGGMCTDECEWGDPDALEGTCTGEGEICLRYNPTEEFNCFQSCAGSDDCRVEEGWSCECLDFFCNVQACIPPLPASLPNDTKRAMLYDTLNEAL